MREIPGTPSVRGAMMAAMDIVIRDAEPAEYPAAGELTARAYLDDGLLDFGESDPYLDKLRDAADRASHAQLLVAVDPVGTLLGSVTFVPGSGPYAELSRGEERTGEFRMLAVRASARGHGAGEALARACVERARGLGLTRLVLSSQPTMRAAHRLYSRLGFVRTPDRDWSPVPELEVRLWAFALEL